MADICTILDNARLVVGVGHEKSRFRKTALRMVDELENALTGCDEDLMEPIIARYYEKVTGAQPYEHPGSRYKVRLARVVLVCRDMLQGRNPKAKYMFGKEANRSTAFSGALFEYERWMRARGQSEATVSARLQRVDVMLRHLESVGLASLRCLTAGHLTEFIASLEGRFTATGKSNILYTLRSFFSCPAIASDVGFDPFGLLTNIHTPKHTVIPSVYSASEVSATLASLDRSTDAGRTHYLVFVLASVYGLRSMDIKNLEIGDVDFANDTIAIVQHKTGAPLVLPLPECVKLPLLDYMLNTRRDCESKKVLVRHRGPAGPYSPRNHFGGALSKAMGDAGVIAAGRHAGLHSLRHTLATRMTSEGVPANEVAVVLGHTSVSSTKAYIWSDIERLRLAALEVE